MTRTDSALRELARPLLRASSAGWGLGAAASLATVFGGGAWALRLGLGAPAGVTLLAWTAAATAVGAIAWVARRERRRFRPPDLAEAIELAGGARRGALRGQLEGRAGGTSEGLAAAADRTWSEEVSGRGWESLRPMARRLHRRAGVLGIVALVATAALATARPAGGRATLLWRPGAALELLRAPVRLRANPDVVDRGGSVTLHLEAVGQRSATLWSRAPGQSWTAATVLLDSLGRSERRIDGVDADRYFRLTSGSRGSDTVHVRVRLPAFLGAVQVTARYPAYLRLESETLPLGRDSMPIPAGTVLETEGEASTALAGAAWTGPTRVANLAPNGRRFAGRFVPAATGRYVLSLVAADGAPVAGDPVELSLIVVPDSVPVVEVPAPGADTIAPVDLRIPLVIDARDDHGLSRLEVSSRAGGRTVVEPVPLAESAPERALAEFTLDLSRRDLRAGDTVRYHVQAADNSPGRQVGRSREFLIVIPTGADQREAQRQATADARRQLDSLVAASRRLERQAEDLAQERARPQGQPRGDQQSLGFDEVRRSEAVAKSQEDLLQRAEEMRETLEALEEAARRGEQPDTALARRLSEISEQFDRALSPELRQKLADLQKALQSLDPDATREALKQLAEAQQALREALERTKELFRRAALEGELNALAQDAKDLSQQQKAWNETVMTADSNLATAAERALAERTDSLASGLERAGQQLDRAEAQQQMEQIAQQARQAAQQMRNASASAQRGQRQRAQQQGRQAESQMEQVERDAAAQRDQQQEEWRQDVLDALDRALSETAALSRQQLRVAEEFRRASSVAATRREQATVEESAQKLLEQLTALAGRNALVSPQIAVAMAVARREMGLARDAVSSANPNLREAADRAGDAVDALNAAAFQLVRARDDVAGASSGSGLAEALEKMTQMAQQQGQMSQQAGGLLPMAGSAAIQQQLQQIAARQRAMAQELERMRAQGQLQGLKELGDEALELARRLEAGRLDRETVERQQRLFRRMLDAGRTLQGEEEDDRKERQSTAAKDGELKLPPALRQRLGGDGIRFPTWEELQRLSPDERRMVTEYFRRLTAPGGS